MDRNVSVALLLALTILGTEPVNENETFERKVYEGIWTTAV